jgi:hypothetical protein
MKIVYVKKFKWPREIKPGRRIIKPSEAFPDGLRPNGDRQPSVEYSLLGKFMVAINS